MGDAQREILRTESRLGYRLMGKRVAAARPQPGPRGLFTQTLGYTHSHDGTRIALGVAGQGYPMVRTAHWMTHLDWDWRSDIFGPGIRTLAGAFSYLRYDGRGWGLSDRACGAGQLDDWVADLSSVVDAQGLGRFALFGPSGGASIAIRYAALNPQRVSHLVLLGGFARGSLRRGALSVSPSMFEAFNRLIEERWGQENAAFRQLMTSQLWPGATAEQMSSVNHLQRVASSAQTAAAMLRAIAHVDVSADLPRVRCPTLLVHSAHDARVPYAEAQFVVSQIPQARLFTFDSPNHSPLSHETAFGEVYRAIVEFIHHH